MVDAETIKDYMSFLVMQLEGPYKWHIIAVVGIVLTGLITKFIFNTFKWFFLIMLAAALITGTLYALTQWAVA
jgi:uncharacterized membrane protein